MSRFSRIHFRRQGKRKNHCDDESIGYQSRDCAKAVLGGYRPWAYFGFVLGSLYQYLLLRIAVSVIFADLENVPEYHFDIPAMLTALFCFAALYETVMFCYTKKIEKMSVKEIMLE